MNDRRNVLTPEALAMMDAIARSGSFAAAARQLGKVPSALTYSVRQLEDALGVLLFDRRSRQARLTAAGQELLAEGRRLLQEMDAVANRVRRVADGWETQLAIACVDLVSQAALLALAAEFYTGDGDPDAGTQARGTRLRIATGDSGALWAALVSGNADLAIGVSAPGVHAPGIQARALGAVRFLFAVAPDHPLAGGKGVLSEDDVLRHRAVVVADAAWRMAALGGGLAAGQDAITVPDVHAKLLAQVRGLGCGFLPEPLARTHIDAGRLVVRATWHGDIVVPLQYAWRTDDGMENRPGRAMTWWLHRLEEPATQRALLEEHSWGGS
jgi:DNA-binding transcriptional LysR family regulator